MHRGTNPGPEGLREYVLWTVIVAVLCLGLPFLFPAFVLLTFIWIGALIVALDRFDRRGWWVLLGAPLALAWPCFTLFMIAACIHGSCS
jgi:hypothetical protein